MIFGRTLLSSFSVSAIYSFLKCLFYRKAQTNNDNVENTVNSQTEFGPPLRNRFFDPSPPDFGFRSHTNHWSRSTNRALCVAAATSIINFTPEPWWESIVASFSQRNNRFHTLHRLNRSNICKFVQRACITFPNLHICLYNIYEFYC